MEGKIQIMTDARRSMGEGVVTITAVKGGLIQSQASLQPVI